MQTNSEKLLKKKKTRTANISSRYQFASEILNFRIAKTIKTYSSIHHLAPEMLKYQVHLGKMFRLQSFAASGMYITQTDDMLTLQSGGPTPTTGSSVFQVVAGLSGKGGLTSYKHLHFQPSETQSIIIVATWLATLEYQIGNSYQILNLKPDILPHFARFPYI